MGTPFQVGLTPAQQPKMKSFTGYTVSRPFSEGDGVRFASAKQDPAYFSFPIIDLYCANGQADRVGGMEAERDIRSLNEQWRRMSNHAGWHVSHVNRLLNTLRTKSKTLMVDPAFFSRRNNLHATNLSEFTILSPGNAPLRFENSDFTRANYSRTCFPGEVSFKNSNLSHANFKDAVFQKVIFNNATLTGTQLVCSTVRPEGPGSGLQLPGTDFTEAIMWGTNLSGANLAGGNFKEALFDQYTCMINTDLRGAQLKESKNAVKADWTGAIYDDATTFPEGFDPVAHGMMKKA